MPTERLKPAQYSEWDRFVEGARGGSIFHRSWYLTSLSAEVEIHVLRDEQGEIRGGMPLTPTRFLGSRGCRRLPWVVYNSPLVRTSTRATEPARLSEEKGDLVRLLSEAPRFPFYDFLLSPDLTDLMPYLWAGFDTLVGYTYQIAPPPSGDWLERMTPDCRRKLTRARGLLAETGSAILKEDLITDDALDLVMQTQNAKGFRYGGEKRAFSRLWGEIAGRHCGSIYLVRGAKGEALCCALLLRDRRCAYYVGGGLHATVRGGSLANLNRLVFAMMIDDTLKAGLVFDFEGSVIRGVEQFMREWGGRLVTKHRVVKLLNPITYSLWTVHRYWTRHRKTL